MSFRDHSDADESAATNRNNSYLSHSNADKDFPHTNRACHLSHVTTVWDNDAK